jgi:small subunit ribosomal protein S2
MSSTVKDLIDAGIHFGQRRSNWNPKMGPYIYGVRNKIHIIDLRTTIRGLLQAKKFVRQVVLDGKDVVFVGTKRQARAAIEKYAVDVGMPWVIERWLGGTLTNFRTIRERLNRLEELEGLEQSGEIETYSKKMASQLHREKRKITRNLQGIRNMNKLPGCVIVIDTNRESNALREAKGLNIPTIALVDTDGDPDLVDIPIPGNDDSMRSIEVIVRELCEAVNEGKQGRNPQTDADEAQPDSAPPRRRSQRSRFRADTPAEDETPQSPDPGEKSAAEVAASPSAAGTVEAAGK